MHLACITKMAKKLSNYREGSPKNWSTNLNGSPMAKWLIKTQKASADIKRAHGKLLVFLGVLGLVVLQTHCLVPTMRLKQLTTKQFTRTQFILCPLKLGELKAFRSTEPGLINDPSDCH